MGLYIKWMRMPESCGTCFVGNRTICKNGCPLVALPDHHGRLIDADKLEPDAEYDEGEFWAYSVAQVCNAPTIVEAEDE